MENTLTDAADSESHSRRSWIVAFSLTLLVTLAGFVMAIQQFVVKYLWDHSAHTRTIGGLLYMLLGVLGIGLPLLLFLKRKKFGSARPARQWLAAIAIPLAYVLVFALFIEGSMRSTRLILPRFQTPTVVISDENGKVYVEFRGPWRPHVGPGGYNHIATRDGVQHFSAQLDQGFLRFPDRESVTIRGQARALGDGKLKVFLDVDANEPIKFALEDFEVLEMTRDDGQAIDELDSVSGKFSVTILARMPDRELGDAPTPLPYLLRGIHRGPSACGSDTGASSSE